MKPCALHEIAESCVGGTLEEDSKEKQYAFFRCLLQTITNHFIDRIKDFRFTVGELMAQFNSSLSLPRGCVLQAPSAAPADGFAVLSGIILVGKVFQCVGL